MHRYLATLSKMVKAQSSAQPAAFRDGFWWRKLVESSRLGYALGYIDAVRLMSVASKSLDDLRVVGPKNPNCASSKIDHQPDAWEIRIPADELACALDDFYSDSANRSMSLPSAIHYVVRWRENPTADWSALLARLRNSQRLG